MPAELEFLSHFHFLRPAWGLLLLPWLAIIWMMGKKETSRDMFGGIIAPHLLEHLRVERFYSPLAKSEAVLPAGTGVVAHCADRSQLAPAALAAEPGRGRTGCITGRLYLHGAAGCAAQPIATGKTENR